MTATATDPAEAQPKRSKKGLLIGLVLALAGAGGGFYAVQSGLLFPQPHPEGKSETEIAALPDVGFVPIDPLVVSLGPESANRHLSFRAQLEVAKGYESDVQAMLPRVVDVLNGYLRAVEIAELENPASLMRLRAQMLRRIQIVTGEGRVRDLLIMEFVLN
jgi:flagellar FliL protein